VEKEVEKLLRGGANTAVMKVRADVCLHCGERLYSEETVRHFEEIRRKLEQDMFPLFAGWDNLFRLFDSLKFRFQKAFTISVQAVGHKPRR